MAEDERISFKYKNSNPLFEKWITEWRDAAKEKNSNLQFCFSTALQSLKKYPLPLETGRDCKILKGFGDKLCNMLDNKLKEQTRKNYNVEILNQENAVFKPNIVKNKEKKRLSTSNKEYIPQYKSGAYGILLVLYKQSLKPDFAGYLTKLEIIKHGQALINKSFTKPDPGTRYTAWSSMKKLLTEELVLKKSNPAKFSLTEKGIQLAKKLSNFNEEGENNDNNENIENTNLVASTSKDTVCQTILKQYSSESLKPEILKYTSISSQQSKADNIVMDFVASTYENTASKIVSRQLSSSSIPSTLSSKPVFQKFISSSSHQSVSEEFVVFGPHTFDIILIVDNQETCGKKRDQEDPLIAELTHLKVPYEVRNLKVGDYTWICRSKTSTIDLILPYIVERKRMDDFAHSIKDNRYYEQKFRLKRCGISNVTYLIESYGKNDHNVGLPINTLYQAATNTAIHDGFYVKFTDHLKGTAEYLSCFTQLLLNTFKSKTIASCLKDDMPEFLLQNDLISVMTFKEFNQSSIKNKKITVKDLFIKSLLQIRGMSVEKALAIVEKYPSPRMLFEEYKLISESSGEKLLANLQFSSSKKNLGAVLSKTVYQLFTSNF
ncbi:unnamed protein product [Brassicogethes aeneus]|uniref:Crossover junction endonuclease MUS81 n=1 Tax=Brassicogethes aeneus TaxID=1431903 RepID=A0A9P0FJ38_BRAAE|nr:unnamed protein product [Brassicogethes aeneus]